MNYTTLKQSIGLMIGLSSLLPAAQITWQTSTDMFATGDNENFISNNGDPILALNGTTTTEIPGSVTANNVTFENVDEVTAVAGFTENGVTFTVPSASGNQGAFAGGNFSNSNVVSLVNSALFSVPSFTFSGLTVGETYEIQVLVNDSRNRNDGWDVGLNDGTGTTVAVVGELHNATNDNGDFFVGTFIADSSTQTVTMTATRTGNINVGDDIAVVPNGGQRQINALQLRLLDPDFDGDLIPDAFENANDLDPNDPSDAALDADTDGLTNLREFQLGTDLMDADSDDDNLLDGDEVNTHLTNPLSADSDGDTLNDDVEINTHLTNPLLTDSDFDSLSDADEVNVHSTIPTLADSDEDGVNDGTEILISATDPNSDISLPELNPDAVDLLAYWDFNDSSNDTQTIDLVNGYVGDLNPGTTYTADALGHTETAGDLSLYLGAAANAGTGVTVELGEFFNLTAINDQFTISFWQKLDAGEPSAGASSVGASRFGVDRAIMVHLPFTDGNIFFDHGGGVANRVSGAPAFAVDWQQWNHITIVKNLDAKEVWVNGSLALSGANADAALENNHHTVLLGLDDLNRNVVGHIDDFAFYADPLNSTQILALANGEDPRNLDTVLLDSDLDGMPDSYENIFGLNPNVNDADLDLDNDQLTNIEEFNLGTFPNDNDTDDDGLEDGVETNTGVFSSASDTGTNPFMADSDGDELEDGAEVTTHETDPNLADTDGDTYTDGEEIDFGSDPLDASSLAAVTPEILVYFDFDGDSLSSIEEGPDSTLLAGAVLSAESGGFTGQAGDQALDLGTVAGTGAHAFVDPGTHLVPVETNNTVAISWWQNRTGPAIASAPFAAPNQNGQRGLQSHAPWESGQFFVDLMGFRRMVADPTTPDQWQHFVIQQFTDGTVELWIDGILTNEWPQGAADQQFSLTGAINIGRTLDAANMTGQIDDFAIFDGPIPGPHIQTLASGVSVGDFYNFGPQPLVITAIAREDNEVTLTWNSRDSEQYSVFFSLDLQDWTGEIEDGIAADPGGSTSRTFNLNVFGLGNEDKVFFRVER